MALHAIGTADHQNRVVQHLQHTLRLTAKIPVPRCIQQYCLLFAQREARLLGEDRNPTIALNLVMIQKGVLVIHSALCPRHTGQI